MPSAPALDTAEASGERAIQPIGGCTMGISTPSTRVMRLSKVSLAGMFAFPLAVPHGDAVPGCGWDP